MRIFNTRMSSNMSINNEEHDLLDERNDQGFVFIANEILQKCKINGEVESILQCSDSFFIAVYEGILGEPLKGIIIDAVLLEDRIHNCDVVIDALSCEVLNVDLSHITGEDIVGGDMTGIQNLLEILKELLDFILDIDENHDTYIDEQNDSNLISDHDVISDILKEELGSSYESLTTQRKLPTTKSSRLASHSSTLNADVSMIPNLSRSTVSSPSSATCESNSTGEIIRESELLERQLAREYSSRKQKALNETLDPPQELARGAELKEVSPKKGLKDPRKTIKPLTNKFRDSLLTNGERERMGTKDKLSTLRDNKGTKADPRTLDLRSSKVVNREKTSNNKMSEHCMNQRELSVETETRLLQPCDKDIELKQKAVKNVSSKQQKENRLSSVARLPNHVGRSNVTPREEKKTTMQPMVCERDKQKETEELVKSISLRTQEERERSRLENGLDNKDKERVQETCDEINYDGSDISGVLWDDQISPLDALEVLHSKETGLNFNQVGTSLNRGKNEMYREGIGDNSGSPVVQHYHHHFHHPHGTSNHLMPGGGGTKFYRKIIGDKSSGEPGQNKSKDERKRVKFKDDVDMMMITSRLERLKKEMEIDEREQEGRRLIIKSDYGRHLDTLKTKQKKMEKKIKQTSKRVGSRVTSGRQATMYGRQMKVKKARFPSGKARKRSSSVSPKVVHPKRKTAKQIEKGDILLPAMLDEFPFLHLSPHTMQTMRRKQTQQLQSLSKTAAEQRQTKTQKAIEDAEKRQQTLLKILRKDLIHNQRMREQKERKEQERVIKSKLRDKRQASARARRYYEDYQLRMRARLLKRRTREEQIFKNLFHDGLEIQKERVRELRTYAKEQRETRAVKQQNELESLENYYRDQYSMLAAVIAQEKEALEVREKAQEKVIHQMQRNLRHKLQKEVAEIQETLIRDEDDAYFRRLDAERLRKQMQMTAFQNLS